MIFDSHAHLNFDQFSEEEWVETLERAYSSNVKAIVDVATDPHSFRRSLSIPKGPVSLYRAAATTPHDLKTNDDPFFSKVEEAVEKNLLIAIGETGLDYFHSPHTKNHQQKVFERYIELSKKSSLPLIIHCRDAFEDLFTILLEQKLFSPNVLHCFTGTKEDAKKLLDMGWYISFSGIVTYPKSDELRKIVQFVPLDRLLVETDSPYLAPQPKRGKRNEPSFLRYTVETIAKVKNLSFEQIAKETFDNTCRIFALSLS